jgi:RNA polymerase sigma-70 factor (ECF subfamily)
MKGFPAWRPLKTRVTAEREPIAIAKEPPQLDELYGRYAPRVASWASRLAGPSIDAEDLVHEVFLIVHAQLPGYRGREHLTTWLYRITANVVRDRRRRERRLRKRHHEAEPLGWASVPTPVDELERLEATALVYRILDQLGEKYRTVLILFELEELPGDQIAELLDVKLSTVWVWLHRGRAQFRHRLEQHRAKEQSHGRT